HRVHNVCEGQQVWGVGAVEGRVGRKQLALEPIPRLLVGRAEALGAETAEEVVGHLIVADQPTPSGDVPPGLAALDPDFDETPAPVSVAPRAWPLRPPPLPPPVGSSANGYAPPANLVVEKDLEVLERVALQPLALEFKGVPFQVGHALDHVGLDVDDQPPPLAV